MSPRLSSVLNLSRWVAAFVVVMGHTAHFVLARVGTPSDRPAWLTAVYVLRNCHLQAVWVFFVLSGFLVGGGVLARHREGRFQFLPYLVNRVSRIYPVLIAALVLGAACDLTGLRWFDRDGVYEDRQQVPDFEHAQVREQLSWSVAGWNLLNLQTVASPVLGSNLPLWSLANEWWYYLLFPALVLGTFPKTRLPVRGAALLFVAGAVLVFPRGMLVLGLVWGLGALASEWRHPVRMPVPLALIVFGGMVLANGSGVTARVLTRFLPPPLHLVTSALMVGFAFILVLLAVRSASTQVPLPGEAWHERLADFSYSLYLSHYPMLLLLLAAFQTRFGWGIQSAPTPRAFLLILALLPVLYAWAYIVSLFTERRTPQVRHWLQARLRGLEPEKTRTQAG
ncbi:MAG: acyltransferase [Verrucomicrobiales bacterium]|nr:acyltransferase [Verrucomicrobiales bacterium]